jgi:hypothetical protein
MVTAQDSRRLKPPTIRLEAGDNMLVNPIYKGSYAEKCFSEKKMVTVEESKLPGFCKKYLKKGITAERRIFPGYREKNG